MFRISQTGTVEDYVQRFSDLMDQLAAYEQKPDPIHYLTRFLDGLQPGVRVLVAIQQPKDLDTAYTLALLYEELGEGIALMGNSSGSSTHHSSRRQQHAHISVPPPPPPAKWIGKPPDDRKAPDPARNSEDKWQNLKAFRRSKGLCFVCGEKWSREHQCKNNIQLHVVQDMMDMLQFSESDSEYCDAEDTSPENLMLLSAAASDASTKSAKSMVLKVQIQGQPLRFLVDSGSSSCFIDQDKAQLLSGCQPMEKPVFVKVAGGAILKCT
jgi:hypothetical protein